jgi:hypothetical protein
LSGKTRILKIRISVFGGFASNLGFYRFKFDEIYARNSANQILKFDFERHTAQK